MTAGRRSETNTAAPDRRVELGALLVGPTLVVEPAGVVHADRAASRRLRSRAGAQIGRAVRDIRLDGTSARSPQPASAIRATNIARRGDTRHITSRAKDIQISQNDNRQAVPVILAESRCRVQSRRKLYPHRSPRSSMTSRTPGTTTSPGPAVGGATTAQVALTLPCSSSP